MHFGDYTYVAMFGMVSPSNGDCHIFHLKLRSGSFNENTWCITPICALGFIKPFLSNTLTKHGKYQIIVLHETQNANTKLQVHSFTVNMTLQY